MSIKIVIVDDHKIVRESVRLLLLKQPGYKIVGEAENGRAALECVARTSPHVVVMDVRLADENGLVATTDIVTRHPATKVLVLTGYPTPELVHETLRARASGFLTKGESADEFLRAVRCVLSGTIYVSPSAMRMLAKHRQWSGGR